MASHWGPAAIGRGVLGLFGLTISLFLIELSMKRRNNAAWLSCGNQSSQYLHLHVGVWLEGLISAVHAGSSTSHPCNRSHIKTNSAVLRVFGQACSRAGFVNHRF